MATTGLKWDVDFTDLADEYDATIEEMVDAVDQALERIARKVMSQSKKITPVSPRGGRLRDSAEVKRIGLADYSIIYPVWYAIYVHERTELYHPRPPQARAKFLERALRIVGEVADTDIKEEVEGRL